MPVNKLPWIWYTQQFYPIKDFSLWPNTEKLLAKIHCSLCIWEFRFEFEIEFGYGVRLSWELNCSASTTIFYNRKLKSRNARIYGNEIWDCHGFGSCIKTELYKSIDSSSISSMRSRVCSDHQMKPWEESWKCDAQRSIFDELRGVSSGDETLC